MYHMSPGEHPLIDRVCQTAFPEYRGRKIGVSYTYGPLDLRSYWDGGSHTDWVVLDGATMRKLVMPPQSAYDPKVPGADAFMLPPGAIVVAHEIACGKDMGLTVYARPDGIQFLPGPAVELTETERLVLLATRSFTSSYRQDMLRRRGIRAEQTAAARTSLQAKGLLDGRGAVTNAGKNLLGREQWQY